MIRNFLKLIALTCVFVTAPGCGLLDKRVVFATKTQLGLDVSGTAQIPDKVSFTYGRFEGAIVPRSTNGEPYSVYGGIDADVSFFGKQTIKQVFATGEAAIIAANDAPQNAKTAAKDATPRDKTHSNKSLFFVTDTAYGLKLSAGKQDISPTLMMGFKRVEGAVIPVDKHESQVRSVYADLAINTKTNGNDAVSFPNNGGVRIIQGFATGRAAELRASNQSVKKALSKASSPSAAKAEAERNIRDFQKVAKWVSEGPDDAAKKMRFKKALKGVVEDDGEAAFSALPARDEAAFTEYFRTTFAGSTRAANAVKANLKDDIQFE